MENFSFYVAFRAIPRMMMVREWFQRFIVNHSLWNWHFYSNQRQLPRDVLQKICWKKFTKLSVTALLESSFNKVDGCKKNLSNLPSLECVLFIQNQTKLFTINRASWSVLEAILCVAIGLSSFSNASPKKPNWVMIPTLFSKTKEEYAIGFIVTCVCLTLTFVALLIMLALYLYVIRHSREYAHKKKEIQIEGAIRQYMSNNNYDVYRETDSDQSYEKKMKKSETRLSKKSTREVGFKLKCFCLCDY